MKLSRKEVDFIEGKIVLGIPEGMRSTMGVFNLYVNKQKDETYGEIYSLQIVGEDRTKKHYQFDFGLCNGEFEDLIKFLVTIKDKKINFVSTDTKSHRQD